MTSILLALTMMASHAPGSFYDFELKDIDGKPMPLKQFKDKVVLVVNVASRCGYTPQYAGLQKVYMKYRDRGLVVLGIPANEFRGQEPGTNAEIKEFCTSTYGVTFPMAEKMVVKGEGIHPLYQWLLANGPRHEDIEWNFSKFLIGRDGQVLGRFLPKDAPDGDVMTAAIEKALG